MELEYKFLTPKKTTGFGYLSGFCVYICLQYNYNVHIQMHVLVCVRLLFSKRMHVCCEESVRFEVWLPCV